MIHYMRLNYQPFESIKSGRKTVEIRLNDAKRRLIEVGDVIVFTRTDFLGQIAAVVLARHEFPSFRELFERFPPSVCGGDCENIEDRLSDTYANYYTKEQEEENHALGLEIRRIDVIRGKSVSLEFSTKELWHEFFEQYVSDKMMDDRIYSYDFERVEKDYYKRMNDDTRLYFVIKNNDKTIGQIYLKHIDKIKKQAEIGIALTNNTVKDKGYGKESIELLIDFVFHTLNFSVLRAATVFKNARSQHILEELSFKEVCRDGECKYFELKRNEYTN